MDSLPALEPPTPRALPLNRHLRTDEAFVWLQAGWDDFTSEDTGASIIYGFFVFILSALLIGGLFWIGADYAFFPAMGAFLVVGPALAMGLYEKSRRRMEGEQTQLDDMIFVKTKSPYQLFFIGLILLLLCLLWMRAAVLIYALFFGFHKFPGFAPLLVSLFLTPSGWGLLIVGSLFGALFAALGFAISALSVPMLLNERVDAFTAMGASMTLVWNNLPVMVTWGGIVLSVFIVCMLSGLLGLIIAFPVLGHATWHAYVAIRGAPENPVFTPAIISPETTDG
ncbi:MAG: DUF2189 domain-containing protein [Granulosicoccus sp.]